MTGSEPMAVNGQDVWAYVVELDGGLRVRFDLTDWERLGLFRGQRVLVRQRETWDEFVEAVRLVTRGKHA